MTINPSSGLVQWTPTSTQLGPNNVAWARERRRRLFAVQSSAFKCSLRFPPIARPTTHGPVTTGTVNQLYVYDATPPTRCRGHPHIFLDVAPSGMTINSSAASFSGTPTAAQTGANSVTVSVRDIGGLFATQSFSVQVNSPAAASRSSRQRHRHGSGRPAL